MQSKDRQIVDITAQLSAYKARCQPWTQELWDESDDAYVRRLFSRYSEEDDLD